MDLKKVTYSETETSILLAALMGVRFFKDGGKSSNQKKREDIFKVMYNQAEIVHFSFRKYAFNDIPTLILFVMNLKPQRGPFIKFARLCKHFFPPCSTSTS